MGPKWEFWGEKGEIWGKRGKFGAKMGKFGEKMWEFGENVALMGGAAVVLGCKMGFLGALSTDRPPPNCGVALRAMCGADGAGGAPTERQ